MKARYGEVETPFSLAEEMVSHVTGKDGDRWLEPGAGRGAITGPLVKHAQGLGLNPQITAVEIQKGNCEHLTASLGDAVTVVNQDFLEWESEYCYDIIIGNPPFNCRGLKKVPTNSKTEKRDEGITIWPAFVKKATSLLTPDGLLVFLTPCIWLKPDRAGIYNTLTRGSQLRIRCFSASETVRLFKGEAQTPMVLFSYRRASEPRISVYDDSLGAYVNYTPEHPQAPIPMKNVQLVNELQASVREHGRMDIIKTKNVSDLGQLKPIESQEHRFPSVKTAVLDGKDCRLVVEWSRKRMPFTGQSKLILAHKMYGFPYLDRVGRFGIARRDVYLVVSDDLHYLERCRQVLCSRTAFKVFEATRYRMRFLERYAFELLPREVDDEEQQSGYTFRYKIDEEHQV